MRFWCFRLLFILASVFHVAGLSTELADKPTTGEAPEALAISKDLDPRSLVPTSIDRIGRIWVPVFINNKGPFRMALDTGSDASAILPRVVDKLGLNLLENGGIFVHGVTGSAVVPSIMVDSLKVGDVELGSMTLPILKDAFDGADGILGTRGWDNMRIYLDFEKDIFQIQPSMGERMPIGFYAIPIKIKKNLLIEFEARIGGIKTLAVFDSGSQRTIGNLKLRDSILKSGPNDIMQDIMGVTLDITGGRNMVAPSIIIGPVQVDNLTITFSDVYIFSRWNLNEKPAVLFGMDAIASMKALIIDYRKGALYIKVDRR